MKHATVFTINKSQAIRLPKPVALPDKVKKVDVIKIGNARLITPSGTGWDSWFNSLDIPEDFMENREQPEIQERTTL